MWGCISHIGGVQLFSLLWVCGREFHAHLLAPPYVDFELDIEDFGRFADFQRNLYYFPSTPGADSQFHK